MSLPHSNAELVWSVESRRWVCLEHKPGRKRGHEGREASGEGHRGMGEGWQEEGKSREQEVQKSREGPRGEVEKGEDWRSKLASEEVYRLQAIGGQEESAALSAS